MVKIYVDDMRETPNGFIHFYTVDECVGYIRRMYKQGISNFYLDLDNDAGEEYSKFGGDYINILNRLEDMYNMGHLKHINFSIHIHSMNPVAIQNMRSIILHNSSWMREA